MALEDDLRQLESDGLAAIAGAADEEALEAVRVDLLGRNGRLKDLSKAFGAEPPERKRSIGPILGAVTEAIKDAHQARIDAMAGAAAAEAIDVSLPGPTTSIGTIHPISQVAMAVEQVFTGMGYDIVDGPHIETDDYNFSRLNIPDDHPARDSHDTFWLAHGCLLRTHTSSVQARVYEAEQPPIRKVVVGKVFRYDEVDATHDNTFTQVEGFLVDEGIHAGHLNGTIRTMIGGVLGRDDIEIRMRPSFFPFVEPGFEVDVRVPGASGRLGRWIELLGCGMVHPEVLAKGGIDPERYSGFAFGMGLERLAMVRHSISDIRLFNGGDLRGLRQFQRN
jgi:phenylalanyl-tRNA synthetase alpha chain